MATTTFKPIVAIKKFFFDGAINPTTGLPFSLREINDEIKKLTPEDKAELAEGAAKELGGEVEKG